ncbi:uncharacterized protein LOC115962884 [Quercus lobata]|uniref:uncharacterized protein LOC115962884 n=1 Tax=Quercus lobata TaxID=97700 RepID=UPI001247AE74|nr:uncharacterized protein LOC115962884 [Quercus lobata]
MDMQFTFVHGGWEGNANDSRLFEEAISDWKHGFPWPPTGSYYLVDSGLPISASFLPPHKSTRYHAQEFNSSGRWITLKKELYNYRHSSLQMVIEQSFGVLKARFPILNLMPNFKPIRTIGESDGKGSATNSKGSGDVGASTSSATQTHVLEMSSASKRAMGQVRDNITDTMWNDYVTRGNVR